MAEPHAAILHRLEEAQRPALPAPPRLRLLLLLTAVSAFRFFTVVLLPFTCLLIVALPVFIRFATGERAPGFVGELCWIAALWIAIAWWRTFRRRPAESGDGIVLEQAQHPKLHELVDRLAQATGASPVDEISIGPWSSFGVREEGGGFFGGKRRYLLSLDQNDLEKLDLAELTSILGHELAHFSEGHTRQGLKLARRTRFLWVLGEELAKSRWRFANPIYLELLLFTAIFDRLYASISRRQELQSDAMAIHLVGPHAFASSLGKEVRGAVKTRSCLPRYLDAAASAGDRRRNILREVEEHEPTPEEAELLRERIDAEYHATTRRYDSHPSITERLEQAQHLARQHPELAELEALRGGGAAYDVLLAGGWRPLEVTVSTALIARELGVLHGAIGLRGELKVPPGELHLPPVSVHKFHAVTTLTLLIGAIGGLLLFGVFLAVAVVTPEEVPEAAREILMVIEGSFLAMLLVALWARGVRLTSSASGLVWDGFLGRERIAWDDVEALRANRKRLQVIGLSGGRQLTFTVRGDRPDRYRLADVILELSPRLAFVGWGTGLARVERPHAGIAELPDKVWEEDDELHVEGPGATRLSIGDSHPLHAAIREALQRRLLPAMLERDRERA